MYYQEAERLYNKAKKNHDENTLSEFRKFGARENQMIENYAHVDQYKSCGYKGQLVFDECGWCRNEVPKEDIELIHLWSNGYTESTISVARLPIGKWVSGIDYSLSESGAACGCGIFSNKYDTKFSAINASLSRIEKAIKSSNIKSDLEHLKCLAKVRMNFCQPTLF